MPLVSAIFLSLAVSQLVMLGIYILLYHRRSVLGILSCLLAFSLTSYLLGEGINYYSGMGIPSNIVILKMILHRFGNASALLIWLIALKLFEDRSQIRKVHPSIWLLAITALIMRTIGSYYVNFGLEAGLIFNLATWGYSQSVLLGFALSAVYIAIKGFRSDLVLERRKERVVFILSVAVLLILMATNRGAWVLSVVAGESNPVQPLPTLTYFIYAYFIAAALFFWKFRVSGLSISPTIARSVDATASQNLRKRDIELMEKITRAMEADKLYHQPQLTVSGLADYVDSQEYRVRRAINNHLGYRNFSDFLNHYRIDETSRLLMETDQPISNVGFDVGYTSLSSFYKAFKAKYSVTPKEYRTLHRIHN